MPDRNLATVRATFAAHLRGDEEAMLAAVCPEIVVRQSPDQVDVHDFHGRDGALQAMAQRGDAWEGWTIEASAAETAP